MSGATSQVPVGADPKIKDIITSLDDDKIGKIFPTTNFHKIYKILLYFVSVYLL